MTESPHDRRPLPGEGGSLWGDIALVSLITLLVLMVSMHVQLSEAIFFATRRWEVLQVDEWPATLLALCTGLIWLTWRRYRQAGRELQARKAAEVRLQEALADNRRLVQENLRIQDAERKHLARELHDEMGQYLNAIKIDAVAIGDSGDSPLLADSSRAIIAHVDHVHRVVNHMIGRLRPAGLDELGLEAAIEHCIDQWQQRMPEVRWMFEAHGNFDDLDEPLKLTAFRLAQEGLTNAARHSRAAHVSVRLERRAPPRQPADAVLLDIADDGRGMDPAPPGRGFGLSGMRERAMAVGGSVLVSSEPGKGVRVSAQLPMARASA